MDLPLGGLLGTEGLDALVTCELEAEKGTLATVLGRQQLLPLSSRHTGQVALGPKLGKITCRLTVISDSSVSTGANTAAADNQLESLFGTAYNAKRGPSGERSVKVYERGEVKESPVWGKQSTVTTPSLLLPVPPALHTVPTSTPAPVSAINPVSSSPQRPPVPPHPTRITRGGDFRTDPGPDPAGLGVGRIGVGPGGEVPVPDEDPLHSAMSYVPSEAPRTVRRPHTQHGVEGPDGQQGRAVMSVVLKSLLGLDVGALQPRGQDCPVDGVVVCRAIVAYKLSSR